MLGCIRWERPPKISKGRERAYSNISIPKKNPHHLRPKKKDREKEGPLSAPLEKKREMTRHVEILTEEGGAGTTSCEGGKGRPSFSLHNTKTGHSTVLP